MIWSLLSTYVSKTHAYIRSGKQRIIPDYVREEEKVVLCCARGPGSACTRLVKPWWLRVSGSQVPSTRVTQGDRDDQTCDTVDGMDSQLWRSKGRNMGRMGQAVIQIPG
jgi:hypothetical protein